MLFYCEQYGCEWMGGWTRGTRWKGKRGEVEGGNDGMGMGTWKGRRGVALCAFVREEMCAGERESVCVRL